MDIERALTGGDPRSLTGVEALVEQVLADPTQVEPLFETVFADDPVIRMRAADALEKVAAVQPSWVEPLADRIIEEMTPFDQASVQWHAAEILSHLELTKAQTREAVEIMLGYLENSDDWIVINLTIKSLAVFARRDPAVAARFEEVLNRHALDRRAAVRKQAGKYLADLEAT